MIISRREFATRTLQTLGVLVAAGQRGLSWKHASFVSGVRGAGTEARIPFGAALNVDEARIGSEEGRLAAAVCDWIATAGPLYMSHVRPSPTSFDFSLIDRFLEYSTATRLPVRGHTLIWYAMLPSWVTPGRSREDAASLLERHVSGVVQHCRGRIRAWDVVNEVANPKDGMPNGLRRSFWLDSLGESYIEMAFRAARSADPDAILGYNEYGIEDDSRDADAKRATVLRLCERLRKAGVPIQYLGVQSHLSSGQTFSSQKLGRFLRDIESLGIRVMVSELDVEDNRRGDSAAEVDATTLDLYKRFLEVVLSSSTPMAVFTWGITDRHYWHRHPGKAGEVVQRPLPFDDALRPKPIFRELVDLGIGIKAPGFKA